MSVVDKALLIDLRISALEISVKDVYCEYANLPHLWLPLIGSYMVEDHTAYTNMVHSMLCM